MADRIARDVGVFVQPSGEPHWVFADEVLQARAVISRPVVVQPSTIVLASGVLVRIVARSGRGYFAIGLNCAR